MAARRTLSWAAVLVALVVAACAPLAAPDAADVPAAALADAPAAPTATPAPDPTLGPTEFPPGTNPLTGLPVGEAVLKRRPLLVTVSNDSEAVRPWSGVSLADHVWEAQIEGLARTSLSAVFLTHVPERVGAVRGAHLIDLDELVPMYDGLLVTAGGSTSGGVGGPPRIVERLAAEPWAERVVSPEREFGEPYLWRIADFPNAGVSFWDTLFADAAAVWRWALGEGLTAAREPAGLAFDAEVPRGGKTTRTAVVDYPQFGPQREWAYDEASGRWLSSTDGVPDGDTLAEGQLAADNVVIVQAELSEADFPEDEVNQLPAIDVSLIGRGQAVLLRDGLRYNLRWERTRTSELIRLVDEDGQVVPLKPGTTWFQVASVTLQPPQIIYTP